MANNRFEKNAIIENNVLNNYKENVVFELKDSGAIEISVTHTDPESLLLRQQFYGGNS